jgi:hypothetical protein
MDTPVCVSGNLPVAEQIVLNARAGHLFTSGTCCSTVGSAVVVRCRWSRTDIGILDKICGILDKICQAD